MNIYFHYKNFLLFIIIFHFTIFINFNKTNTINENLKEEIRKIKNYYELNNKNFLLNKNIYKKSENPKVSIISTIYNREKYILRYLRSIQNQFLDDIEIIFIDDNSLDKSVKLIEKFQEKDKRIILIKQNKNKGTLISRNYGVLKSKGEYIILPDSDDILSDNILNLCYNISKENNFEMIRFNMFSDKQFIFSLINNNLKDIIYQPELSTFMIYGFGYLKLHDGIISNKFIKRTTYIKAINNIKKFYLSQHMIYFEDGLINFALYLNSKSLYLLKKIGYYYIFNENSVSRKLNMNLYLKNLFLFLKFVLEYTKNNKYEKNIIFHLLHEYIINIGILNNISNNFEIYEEFINSLYNNEFINFRDKRKLKKMKYLLKKLKNEKKNK